MLAKFSVKKPFTVLVLVLLVIILGVVSLTRMTPDLLPKIELPYVIVVTSYPGATPEEVEEAITKPLEQQMATLENIKSVDSTSSENVSMIMLEFSEDANMDSIVVNIREKVDMVADGWDDYVGTPFILKINPDILPTTVAAVDMEGYSNVDLAAFVNDSVLPSLEGVEGVASVATSGMIVEDVNIFLRDELINATNERVREAIDKQFEESQEELDDAQETLDDTLDELAQGKEKISEGKDALEKGQKELARKLAQAQREMDTKQTELLQGQLMANTMLLAYNAELEGLNQMEALLVKYQNEDTQLQKSLKETKAAIDLLTGMRNTYDQLVLAREGKIAQVMLDQGITYDEAVLYLQQNDPAFVEAVQGIAQIEAVFAQYGTDRAGVDGAIATLTATYDAAQQARAALAAELLKYDVDLDDLSNVIAGLREKKAEVKGQIDETQSTLSMLENGQIALEQAKTQLTMTEATAQMGIYSGMAELIATEQGIVLTEKQLDASKEQLDQALETMEEARESAYTKADLTKIVTINNAATLLAAQNFAMPAGYAVQDGMDYMVSVGDKFTDVDEIKNLVLFDMGIEGMEPITVADIADVLVLDNSATTYARINGRDGVLLSFTKQSDYATATVADNIKAEFEELRATYDGLGFTVLMDQGEYIHLIIDSVFENLIIGAVLAVIILIIFLRDIRPTAVIACSIPISVMFALVLMYFSGVTLNMISLAGLAVGVGMLVDNSIVVIENIYRLRSLGYSRTKAALSGAAQVSAAITSSTLTTICVFFPIVFLEGLTRQIFTDMALTIAYSLLASLIVALTLVPAMAMGMLRRDPKARKARARHADGKKRFEFMPFFEKTVAWALDHKAIVLVASVVLLGASLWMALGKGFSYMPESSSSQLMVSASMPEGSVLEDTIRISDDMCAEIETLPGVETVGAMLSSGMSSIIGLGGDDASEDAVTMYVILDESAAKNGAWYEEQIQAIAGKHAVEVGVTGMSGSMSSFSLLSGSGVGINLYARDLDVLRDTARDIAGILREQPGLEDVSDGIGETTPELRISVDKNAAMGEGLTVAQVYQQLAGLLRREVSATSMAMEGRSYDVILHLGEESTPSTDDVRALVLTATSPDGSTRDVALADIATIAETESFSSISRTSQRRYVSLSAGIAQGYNVSLVTQDVKRALDGYALPLGVEMEFSGENETIMGALEDLLYMLLLGIVIVYLIMVAQFQSLKSPLIVMFTIPLAMTGGLLALLIAGFEVSVVAMIGFVMLVGIIVNNGIVLIDYMNILRLEGKPRREAVLEASVTRLRPVLMTALTTILGLLPMALGIGMGSDLMQPVAVTCIGGLIYATLMTLYVVPVMYDMINKKDLRRVREEDLVIVEE